MSFISNGDVITSQLNFRSLAYAAATQDLSQYCFSVNKFGHNLDLDAGVKEDVWATGNTKLDTAGAEVLEILSSDGNDTSAGTGLQTLRISGYDASGNIQEETITMNGVTAVETLSTYTDIYRAFAITAGTNVYNVGSITIRQKTSVITLATIPPEHNQTQMSQFMVPLGYTGCLVHTTSDIGGLQGAAGIKIADIGLEIQEDGEAWRLQEVFGMTSSNGPLIKDWILPLTVGSLGRLKFTATAEKDNTQAYISYQMICIKDNYLTTA